MVWVVVAVVAAVAVLVVQLRREPRGTVSLVVRLALLGVALLLARYALTRDVRSLKQTETPGKPVPAARQGVLIMNLKSGGGKAEKFDLVDACRERGSSRSSSRGATTYGSSRATRSTEAPT